MCVEFGAVRRSAQTSNNFNVQHDQTSHPEAVLATQQLREVVQCHKNLLTH